MCKREKYLNKIDVCKSSLKNFKKRKIKHKSGL